MPGPCPTLCVEKSTSPSLPCLPKGRWWNGLIVPVLFLSTILPFLAYSGADEYAPKSVDKAALVEKICGACAAGNAARVAGLVVAGAPHNCAGAEEAFVAACVAFLTGGAVEGACFDTLK